MNDVRPSKKRVDESIPAVLRRRYKSFREDGYNEQALGVLERAAKEIERLYADFQELTCGDPRKVCPNCRDGNADETADGWKCLHRAVASWSALWSRDPSADFTALNKILAAHNPFDSSSVEPTRCTDCGVALVPEARHFSGCKSHPGERAAKARTPLRDSDAAFNLGVLPTEQPEKASELATVRAFGTTIDPENGDGEQA